VADAWIGRRAVTGVVARPSTMMMATLCMLVLIATAVAVAVGDVDLFGLGLASLIISALSIASFRLATGYDARSPWSLDTHKDGDDDGSDADDETMEGRSPGALWARVALDGAMIFAAGYALSQTGDAIS